MLWHGNECGKNKSNENSRQPSPVTIIIGQKQLENVKRFKYLGRTLTNDGICTCEIKSRIAMAKTAFNKNTLFNSKLDLNLRKNLLNATYGTWLCMVLKFGRFGQQIRNTWKVLKCGAGEDQLDRSCEK